MRPAQLRAARGLLDWGRNELTAASGVSTETIKNIEHGRFRPSIDTLSKLRLTFANHGVGFFDVLARAPVWGVFLEPQHAGEQDNRQLPAAAHAMLTRMSLVNRVADAIVAIIRQRGHCRPSDLEAQGFVPDEIAETWRMASALAHVELAEGDE